MNIRFEGMMLAFEDVSTEEAIDLASELRDMLLSAIPDLEINDPPDTDKLQGTTLAIEVGMRRHMQPPILGGAFRCVA